MGQVSEFIVEPIKNSNDDQEETHYSETDTQGIDQDIGSDCQLPCFFALLPTQDQQEKAKHAPQSNHIGCSVSS